MTQEKKIETFLEKIKTLYPEDLKKIKKVIRIKPEQIFRINTLLNKNSISISLEHQKADLENSFVYIGKEKISLTEEWKQHTIYVQSLSSMLPALSVKQDLNNAKVLDLCAAPGSKTTQIASLMNNSGSIVAVEPDRRRFLKLKNNCSEQGVTNTEFINTRGEFLINNYPEYNNHFDVVFVDAPCSNENKLNISEPKTFEFWNPKRIKGISKLQKKLLQEGINALSKNGVLLYSTCTYSVEENELVVNKILEENENIVLEDIELNIDVLKDGFTKWKDSEFYESLRKTKRVIPNRNFRAFYLARFRKI